MPASGPRGMRNAYRQWCAFRARTRLQSPPALPAIAKTANRRMRFSRIPPLLFACLAACLLATIALEAFDKDLSLWPLGAQDFGRAHRGLSLVETQPLQIAVASSVTRDPMMTAGEFLVLQYRPRSALATGVRWPSFAQHVAEPWRQYQNAAPVLGHVVCWGQRDIRNSTG